MNNMQGMMLAQTTKSEIAEASLHSNQVGIYLWNCSENTIMGNMITSSVRSSTVEGYVGGAGIDMILCTKNTIRGNTFSDNFVGVHLNGSSNNVFYRNNFVGNNVWTEDDLANTWDDRNSDRSVDRDRCPVCGQPRSVGNYWDDYTGEDDGSPTQAHNCPGDGIGDTLLSHHGVDYYPLMQPWIPVLGDLDYNGVVNILDLAKAAINFRKPSP
jgi:parallel beta-helix repeat protein